MSLKGQNIILNRSVGFADWVVGQILPTEKLLVKTP